MRVLARLRRETRDLLELVLVPGLAAILPWPLCFRLFRRLCRSDFLYRELTWRAFEQADARGWVQGDPVQWRQSRRLVSLIDHADYYLASTRSDRWMARHMQVSGKWPQTPCDAALLCTFHWGAGMWALRSVRAAGLHAHALTAPHRREDFAGRRVQFWYYSRRLQSITTALGRESIEISRMPRRILETLAHGEQILALVDIAVDPDAALSAVQVLDRRALVPRGLLRLAAQKQIPLTLYLNGFRMSDGMRTLEITQLGVYDDAEALIEVVFAHLDQAIRRDPAAWHFWPSAAQFFGDAVV